MTEPIKDIKKALDAAVKKTQERDTTPKPHFRMSSMGQCVRAQVAKRAGLKPTNPWATHTSFKMWGGTVIGREIQTLLEAEGYLEKEWTEKEVTYRSYVGHIDGYTLRLPCGPTIVELKTCDDAAVKKPDWPEHYLWQGLTYCLATGCKQLQVFQFGKNQGLSRDNVFYLTRDWEDRIGRHIDAVEAAWGVYEQTGQLPPHVHNFGWESRTCAYLETEAA